MLFLVMDPPKLGTAQEGKTLSLPPLAWVAPVPWANLFFTRFLSACSLKICQRELTSVVMFLLHSNAVFSHPLCRVRRGLGAVGAGDDKWPPSSLVWTRVTSVLPSWLSAPCPPRPRRPLLTALLCCLPAGLSHPEAVNGPDGERSWTVQCLPFCPMTGSQDCEWKKFSKGREEKAAQSLNVASNAGSPCRCQKRKASLCVSPRPGAGPRLFQVVLEGHCQAPRVHHILQMRDRLREVP